MTAGVLGIDKFGTFEFGSTPVNEWSYGSPVYIDNTNFEWSFGAPYIITSPSGTITTFAVTISAVSEIFVPLPQNYDVEVTINTISTVLPTVLLKIDIPFVIELGSVSYIGTPTITASGFNLDGFNISNFNSGVGTYTLTLDTLRGLALEIGAETTVLDDLETIVPFVINAITSVLGLLGTVNDLETEINAVSGNWSMGVFGVDPFGAFIFGAGHGWPLTANRSVSLTIDSLSTFTALAHYIRGLATVSSGVTTFMMVADEAVWSYLNIGIDSVTGTTIDLKQAITALFNTIIDSTSEITIDLKQSVEADFDIIINSESGTTITLRVKQGYPLRVILSADKRQALTSPTTRTVALSVDR